MVSGLGLVVVLVIPLFCFLLPFVVDYFCSLCSLHSHGAWRRSSRSKRLERRRGVDWSTCCSFDARALCYVRAFRHLAISVCPRPHHVAIATLQLMETSSTTLTGFFRDTTTGIRNQLRSALGLVVALTARLSNIQVKVQAARIEPNDGRADGRTRAECSVRCGGRCSGAEHASTLVALEGIPSMPLPANTVPGWMMGKRKRREWKQGENEGLL
ncbi:hypothetical protein IWX49DRAFT_369997 [Phyllosticta citricarpa]|uniref:Secreted protein n=2 Tax=Phyllosticta TaxID=121621 RepID=A0ABR1MML3_9PEZI